MLLKALLFIIVFIVYLPLRISAPFYLLVVVSLSKVIIINIFISFINLPHNFYFFVNPSLGCLFKIYGIWHEHPLQGPQEVTLTPSLFSVGADRLMDKLFKITNFLTLLFFNVFWVFGIKTQLFTELIMGFEISHAMDRYQLKQK